MPRFSPHFVMIPRMSLNCHPAFQKIALIISNTRIYFFFFFFCSTTGCSLNIVFLEDFEIHYRLWSEQEILFELLDLQSVDDDVSHYQLCTQNLNKNSWVKGTKKVIWEEHGAS